jgi:hypothetical protein
MKKRGYSFTEVLLGLSLSLFMFIAAFEFLGVTRSLFTQLKNAEEENLAAVAALEKVRIELAQAGRGLVSSLRRTSVAGIEIAGTTLTISVVEQAYDLAQDTAAGQILVRLRSVSGLSPRREACLVEGGWSELHTISSCGTGTITLGEPLQASFSKGGGKLLLIEKIAYFLDGSSCILRRKVNGGSPQPLLEGVAACDFSYDATANLAKASFSLQTSQEKKYETSVFPKNIGLAFANR